MMIFISLVLLLSGFITISCSQKITTKLEIKQTEKKDKRSLEERTDKLYKELDKETK